MVIVSLPMFPPEAAFALLTFPLVFFGLLDATSIRGTPGKRLFGIAVITGKGQVLSFEAAAFRAIVTLYNPFCWALAVASFPLAFTRVASLTDLLTRTRVIELTKDKRQGPGRQRRTLRL